MGTNNFMTRLCGFIVAFVIAVIVFGTTWNSGFIYEARIQQTTAMIVLIWGILLYRAKGTEPYNKGELLIAIVLFIGLSLFMGFMWHQGYITNTPLIGINATHEGLHRDTLYHNAIASSIAYYGYPSVLINSEVFHSYHFGSHLILGFISSFLDMPTIFTYSYLYPVLFFPLYSGLILSVGKGIKRRLGREEKITIPDIIVLMSFMTFFILPQEWSTGIANWKTSWLISESFCVANVLGLLFLQMWLALSEVGVFQKRFFSIAFLLIVVPIFISAITMTKISVGLIVSIIISYLLFRIKGIDYKFLSLELLYVGLPLIIHHLLSTIYSPFGGGATEPMKLFPLHFMRTFVKDYSYGIHIMVFFFFAFLFLVYRLRKASTFDVLLKGIVQRKYLSEEVMLLVCVLTSLPGLLFAIGGGSAFYFSAIQQIVATVLLIGYNIPDELFRKIYYFYKRNIRSNIIYKAATILVCFCLSINFVVSSVQYARQLWRDCRRNREQYFESIKENSYWSVIEKINKISEGHKEDYYIYVCSSANVWNRFKDPDSALFFYPAMTGIVCIGELYFENGKLYTNNDVLKPSGGYTYKPLIEKGKLTEEDAYRKAKEDGKKAIIYIHDNSMDVVEIES